MNFAVYRLGYYICPHDELLELVNLGFQLVAMDTSQHYNLMSDSPTYIVVNNKSKFRENDYYPVYIKINSSEDRLYLKLYGVDVDYLVNRETNIYGVFNNLEQYL